MCSGRCLRDQIFFFLLRTALKDHPKGPPTANSHQPPTATSRQPPTATNRRQPPTVTNRQLPTTANRHQPPITNHQPPPTTTNRHQPPVANCQPPTANRQPPPTMVEHMECPRAFVGKLVPGHLFFCVTDRLACATELDKSLLRALAGAVCTADRAYRRGLREDDRCPYCGKGVREDESHLLWWCGAWKVAREPFL